jgi:hypothetical protein
MTDLELPPGASHSPAPGVTIARRSFFGTVAAACAAASLPGATSAWRSRQREGDWTVEQFVREVTPVCKELVADRSARGQDRYLHTLAALAVRLGEVAVPENSKEVGPGHHIGSNHGPEPFTMLHWVLAPGAIIRPHAHTYGNVVTLGLSGEALVSNYEQVGSLDCEQAGEIEVVRVQEQVLRRGSVNLVSLARHYVHGFVAGPDGASGLDITTRIVPRRTSPTLVVGDAKDAQRRTFHARWQAGN